MEMSRIRNMKLKVIFRQPIELRLSTGQVPFESTRSSTYRVSTPRSSTYRVSAPRSS